MYGAAYLHILPGYQRSNPIRLVILGETGYEDEPNNIELLPDAKNGDLCLKQGRTRSQHPQMKLNNQIARRGFPGFHQTRSTSSLSHAVNAGRQIIAHSPEDSAACFPAPDL